MSIHELFVALRIASRNYPMAIETTDIEIERINRLKIVLAEKKRTNKWLCEQLNVSPSTVQSGV